MMTGISILQNPETQSRAQEMNKWSALKNRSTITSDARPRAFSALGPAFSFLIGVASLVLTLSYRRPGISIAVSRLTVVHIANVSIAIVSIVDVGLVINSPRIHIARGVSGIVILLSRGAS